MRGLKTLHLLEKIADGMENMGDVAEAFLKAKYAGIFPNTFDYQLRKIQRKKSDKQIQRDIERTVRDQFYKLMYKLKNDGLLEIKDTGKNRIINLTTAGLKKLTTLRQQKKNFLPPLRYNKEANDQVTIIIFDVPEKERSKRDWIRRALHILGFTPIQKSVWVGKNKIPKDFLEDLKTMNALSFVEIFEITKTGSLKQIN